MLPCSKIIFVFFITWQFCSSNQDVQQKPNIIIMLMDDMGWGDVGINGDTAHETPNLDRMAAEGMQFPDFYAAAPLCSPSRAAFLTGRLPIRNGFYTDNIHGRNSYTPQEIVGGISDWEILLSEILAEQGYRNKIVGKWHLGHQEKYMPLNHGFHEFFGSTNCHFGPYDNETRPNIAFFKDDKMIGRYFQNIEIDINTRISNLTQWYTKEAIEFITSQSQPFFLYWTPDSLHAATFRSSEWAGRSKKDSPYGDALMEIDDGVGQILETIRKNETLAENTFVFFTSDNGAALMSTEQHDSDSVKDCGSNGLLLCGKQTTFEGGMRAPAIAWWPSKIKPGLVNRHTGTIMDLYRTVANLANASVPADRELDSFDLTPALFENKVFDENIYYYRGNQLMAIRSGDYKAHFWTFTTTQEETAIGIDYCPGQFVRNVTTDLLTDYTKKPKLFQVVRDAGERYPISETSPEYESVVDKFLKLFDEHVESLTPGEPVLNWCDNAVMHWSPPGCDEINMCLPVPQSEPYKCDWPH